MPKNTLTPIAKKPVGPGRLGCTLLAAFILLVVSCFGSPAHAELPMVTGQNWKDTDRDAKLAFLLGIATMVKVEQNLIGDPPPPGTVSFAPAIAKGVGDMSLTEIMNRIDTFFADNPESMDKPVVEVIWEDIVIPQLEAAGK
jgi:hypothetical protein